MGLGIPDTAEMANEGHMAMLLPSVTLHVLSVNDEHIDSLKVYVRERAGVWV